MSKIDEKIADYLYRAQRIQSETYIFQRTQKDERTLEIAKMIQLEELADREIKVVNRQMPVNGGSCG